MKIKDSKVYDNIDKKNIICFKYDKLDKKELHFCFFNKKTLKNKTIKMFYTKKKNKIINLTDNILLHPPKLDDKNRNINKFSLNIKLVQN